ncbi:hypothetical protein DES36_1196 [Alkalibaculum bacchi]|uniref:Uncharacterized protein n=1 Tax=Alkalibaculum bacchi TaxID=645887 RepID=A0A366HYR1_9FIRM|nr:hypothetical protein [Alkalibaculum bacchi]RBP59281.1 hypothetical protein DES36_1196 [Alkalibaculum bacchi]
MLENNVYRMIMLIGAIIIIAILINLLTNNYGEMQAVIQRFFALKLQKY